MKRSKNSSSKSVDRTPALTLLLVNIGVFALAIYQNWSMQDILLLYWAESLIIGVSTLLKLLIPTFCILWIKYDGKRKIVVKEKLIIILVLLAMAGFFSVHFGGFMVAHLFVILALLESELFGGASAPAVMQFIGSAGFMIAFSSMVVSHTISFCKSFRKRTGRKTEMKDLFTAPYKRIITMHIAVILGAFLVVVIPGAPGYLLMLIKTIFDYGGHKREHNL